MCKAPVMEVHPVVGLDLCAPELDHVMVHRARCFADAMLDNFASTPASSLFKVHYRGVLPSHDVARLLSHRHCAPSGQACCAVWSAWSIYWCMLPIPCAELSGVVRRHQGGDSWCTQATTWVFTRPRVVCSQRFGVDTVCCLSVNDPFVMDAWADDLETAGKIEMIADGMGMLTKALLMDTVVFGATVGYRCKRCSMVIHDGVVQAVNVEQSLDDLEVRQCCVCDVGHPSHRSSRPRLAMVRTWRSVSRVGSSRWRLQGLCCDHQRPWRVRWQRCPSRNLDAADCPGAQTLGYGAECGGATSVPAVESPSQTGAVAPVVQGWIVAAVGAKNIQTRHPHCLAKSIFTVWLQVLGSGSTGWWRWLKLAVAREVSAQMQLGVMLRLER